MAASVFEFSAQNIKGEEIALDQYKGKVLVIVNVASRCGFTPQYKGLEEIYNEYREKGFEVLGFPCNQFGAQEPGSNDEIAEFCDSTYKTTFPMFAKVEVNGTNTHPLYGYLKKEKKGVLGTGLIKWNFTKFLVDRNGQVVERFAPQTEPKEMKSAIEVLL